MKMLRTEHAAWKFLVEPWRKSVYGADMELFEIKLTGIGICLSIDVLFRNGFITLSVAEHMRDRLRNTERAKESPRGIDAILFDDDRKRLVFIRKMVRVTKPKPKERKRAKPPT